ncbi:MAG: Fic family protein [Coriobacteriaceae bacterium]|nr:Fic family protein [Coriobacteriaceae bacterium]
MALIRMEERITRLEIGPALRKHIARLEAISTIRIDGKNPSLRTLIELESTQKPERKPDSPDSNLTTKTDSENEEPTEDSSLESLWYLETLEWLSQTIEVGGDIDPEIILDIHSRCVCGESAAQSGFRFRENPYKVPENLVGIYKPPAPDDVMPLIEDLCDFINKDIYSPITQTALAHFQFESIKPFKSSLDRTGRALSHAIIYRRGLVERIIPPIGLMPAIHTKYHAEHLLPYDFGFDVEGLTKAKLINEWARFCGNSVELAAQVVQVYIDAIINLEKSWNQRVGKTSKGSAAQELLLVLPETPRLTVSSAMKLLDKSFSATNDALNLLRQLGVLRLAADSSDRNRIFEAAEVFDAVDELEKLLLAQNPVARNSFFSE